MADRSAARISQSSAECIRDPRVRTRPHEPFSDPANAIEDEVHEVLAICECNAVAALRITLIANAFLEAEINRLTAMSSGFARGKVRKKDALTMCRLLRRPVSTQTDSALDAYS
jgi:hypothetical protein